MSAASGLAIWTDHCSDRCVLRLRGQLVSETVGLLHTHVDQLGCRWCAEVVVDVGHVVRMDEVGARLLVGLGHYVSGRDGRFLIQGAGPDLEALISAAEIELAG